MAEFKAGTREQVKNGEAQYVAGDIVAKDATVNIGEERRGSRVFKSGTKTRTKTVSIIQERDSNGNITKSKTILFVEKNGTFQPAASKRDGEWNFSDPDYPLMAGVAALIGVLGAIGAGFIKYGEVMSKLDSMEAFNPDPIIQSLGEDQKDIAVLEKTIQVLELEIQELKASSKNPLAN